MKKVFFGILFVALLTLLGCNILQEVNEVGTDIKKSYNNALTKTEETVQDIKETKAKVEETLKDLENAKKEINEATDAVKEIVQ